MSDIYVFSSNDNTNDYSTMGLVGALTPTECTFKETANGESIVELTHPLDSFGRYAALQRGNILAVPVPVRTTPEIHNGQCVTTVWTYKVKPLNQLTSTAQRTLYMWRFSSSPKVAVLNAGEEITVIWKANEEEPATGQEDIHPWKAKSKYGEGWIDPDALELVTTHSIEDDPAAIEEIQSPWTVTKQYFRIYETKKSINEISVTARHISYDLLYNMTSYRMGFEASLQEILDGVLGDCYAEHQFSAHTNLEGTQTGNWYDQRNPIDVFLNEDDGLCKRFEVDLIRNNYDLYFLKNPGINRGVRIQYGKNMTGIDFTTSDDEVATRIVPVGEKEDGTKLYLDDSIAFPGTLQYGSRGNTVKELQSRLVSLGYSVGSTGIDGIFEWRTENGLNAFKADAGLPENGIYDEETHKALMEALGVTSEPYIDSEHINDYPIIHVYELKCENCTVGTEEDGGGKVTEEIARARMREQAEKLLENGCDQPKIEMSVEFINLGDTEEYKQFRNLENCFLYDYVIVQHPTMDIDVTAQIMEIEWDCLLDRMVSVEIGSVGKTLANTGITSWQIPNGFSGSKIAGGTISGGALQSDIISVRHMQAESINTEALQAACVTAVKIAAGAIEATHISVEAIDAVLANIDTAVIEKAEIDWAEIASLSAEIANIAKAQITEANINQANINWANIANLTATVSNIANAIIEDATISSAQIDDLNAVVAEIIHAQVATGDFSLAEIENLLASAFILEQGSANSMMIKNLVVTDANLLNATIGKLIMPGDDGKYYEVTIGSDGSISTSEVTVTDGEISAGQMNDGRQIVTTTINADSINGSNVTAQQAILGTILTTALTAGKITAGEALLSSAVIPTLYTTSIQSIGNSLRFESNEMIQSIVSDVNSNAEDLTNYISSTNSELENLQGQIDGAITSWFYGVPPTNDNPPANEWTTTDQKNIHLGDLYYDTITGYCYRWQVQNNQYSWQRITDTDVTKALQDAEKAQDTADSKRRVFVSQPVPPYEVGDLWVQGSTGDILRCQTAKTSQQSYSSSDWVLASKYTDDTAADAAQATANANTTAIGSLNTRVTQAETSITQTQNKIELMASEIETELEDIRSDTDFATPYISATPPETAPEAGKLWLDEGVEPSVLRKWRGADVPTEREYTETRVGCGKNLLDITKIDNDSQPDTIVEVNGNSVRIAAAERTYGCGRVHLYLPAGTYILAADITVTKGTNRIGRRVSTDGGETYPGTLTQSTGTGQMTFTIQQGEEWNQFTFFCSYTNAEEGDVTYSNIRLYAGTDATAFEPYQDIPFLALDNAQGQIESVAVEAGCRAKQLKRRNLLQPVYITQTINGVTFTVNDDGSVTINGTATSRAQYSITRTTASRPQVFAGQTFTLFNVEGADQSFYSYAMSVEQDIRLGSSSKTFTMTQDDTLYISIAVLAGKTVNNVTVYPQLELGSVATAYEPYKSVLPITGRESVAVEACGKNLLDFREWKNEMQNGVTITNNGDGTVTVSGSPSASSGSDHVFTYSLGDLLCPADGKTYTTNTLMRVDKRDGSKEYYGVNTSYTFSADVDSGISYYLQKSAQDYVDGETFTPMVNLGDVMAEYEPYRSMGGGTVTPTEPLYGLPGAEDTVEVSVDGDVLVTRRTAVLELDGTETNMSVVHTSTGYDRLNIVPPKAAKVVATADTLGNVRCSHYETVTTGTQWSKGVEGIGVETTGQIIILDAGLATLDAWKSYLAAQASAGTPVTIVYELAAPETEALTAISPIAPVPGQLNIATDADALTATIHGSGWETVNDTSSIQDALANLDGDLASLINEVGVLNGEVGSIAQQIISPDGIKNIVFDSTEYQAMANTVEQNANELSVTQTTVTDINGRVETIEGTVRISGSNIDIGRSDSNVQLHLDNTGWSISEGGQETIYARQNRVVAPRFQTTSLIFGALAFNSSGGHFRLMKYGG